MFLPGSTEHIAPRTAPQAPDTLPLITLLRAFAALTILWHHYAIYPPLREWAAPLLGDLLDLLQQHARATQVFFVIGGYALARSLAHHHWTLRGIRLFVVSRYLRLGVPYLALIALTIPILHLARGWVPDEVLGAPPTLPQFLAHLFFLQGLLGYEQLSAGLWFVCINFQLCLVHVLLLWAGDACRGRIDLYGLCAWGLSILSLFHFNLDEQWDNCFVYFFPYFFFGVVIQRCRERRGAGLEFWLFLLLLALAQTYEWRWRISIAAGVGLLLFLAETSGRNRLPVKWPAIRHLGEISYSLFLVHFPVLLLVSTLWSQREWQSPWAAVGGLLVAFVTSLLVATAFHHLIEKPAAHAGRQRKKKLASTPPPGREALESG